MIGILTFHRTRNYGAILQCYALQKFLLLNNLNCETIDYNNKYLKRIYSLNPFSSKNIKGVVKKIITLPSEYINQKGFNKFTKKYIRISQKKYNESSIKNANNIYESFLAGSDQIWNYELSGKDNNYFMNFCDCKRKKNSYAASFGSGMIKEVYLNTIFKLLEEQNNISIRENEIIEFLQKKGLKKRITQCIDPVFLLDEEQWSKIADTKKIKLNNYIFVYEVAVTPYLKEYASYLQKKLNKKVIFVSKSKKNIKGGKKLSCVTPELFLSLIKNADYVLTSSFHGMAFSLIFKKQFLFDLPSNKQEFGSRLTNLSQISGTQSQIIKSNFEKCNLNKLNYNLINNKLEKEIKKSKEYLLNILTKGENHE